MEGFLNSSNSFTFLAQSHGLNLYTHDQKRFDKIKGTFEIADTPPMAIYADDVNVNETAGSANITFKLTETASSYTRVVVIDSVSFGSAEGICGDGEAADIEPPPETCDIALS